MSTMADRDGVIWLEGEMVPWREAKIHVLTHTLHYGMGVFEGVRAYHAEQGTAIFRLQEHTDRLFRSAHILKMPMPYDRETLNEAQKAAVRENNLDSAYIRPMCFYGSEGMGLRADNLKVHCMVAAWEWGAYLGAENMEKGIRIRVSSFTRHHVNITMCRAKANGNYMNSMLALQEALHDGYDEALLLDAEGYVMEGSGENIFIVRDGIIYTPDLTSALDGITRKTVIELAGSWVTKWWRSALPGMRSISPTKPSSPAVQRRLRRSARSTIVPSATAAAGRSPSGCSRPISIWCMAGWTATGSGWRWLINPAIE